METVSLVVSHWQDFAKRLRHRSGRFRFYHCGEYGETTARPHYHAAIFGLDFSADRELFKRGNNPLWTSPLLEELWGHGFATIGKLTAETAQYVAGYIQKKLTGTKGRDFYETDQVDEHTGEVFSLKPPYSTMSRRPGIGKTWLDKFHTDVYPSDHVISKGIKSRPPAFYDYCLNLRDPSALAALKRKRAAEGRKHRDNNTPERLATRETVSIARHNLNRRNTL